MYHTIDIFHAMRHSGFRRVWLDIAYHNNFSV
nr:MAG TPA: hypothetical protein [Caudoviricetes sp.]